jgi:DNA integrity scanning protein DisA with diadenylate cyclase activity
MNLEQQVKHLEDSIERYQESIDLSKYQLSRLKSLVEVTANDLYNGIDRFIDVVMKKESYVHILGGDGRSQPWSETRVSLVADIKVKSGYYVDEDDFDIITDYVRRKYSPVHIKKDLYSW